MALHGSLLFFLWDVGLRLTSIAGSAQRALAAVEEHIVAPGAKQAHVLPEFPMWALRALQGAREHGTA